MIQNPRDKALRFLKEVDLRPSVGGTRIQASDGERIPVVDPATGETVADVPAAAKCDVAAAVDAGRAAFESGGWSRAPAATRASVLWRIAELIEQHAQEFALLEVLDNGKPLRDATRIDVPQAASHFRYQAASVLRLEGSARSPSLSTGLTYLLPEPEGLVAAIIPWNFPLIMASRVAAPALAAGNSVVLKPSEETSITALLLVSLVQEAGLPHGVLSVLPGLGETTGRALASNAHVDHLAFTGGHEAARQLVTGSATGFQRLTLELGGKSPAIVLPDADISKTVGGLSPGDIPTKGRTAVQQRGCWSTGHTPRNSPSAWRVQLQACVSALVSRTTPKWAR